MKTQPLYDVLEATGYIGGGKPAARVLLDDAARDACRSRNFRPDAMWRGQSLLTVYFKCAPDSPPEATVAEWRKEIWNEGVAPLLWVVSPNGVDVYNGFAQPRPSGDAAEHRIRTFKQAKSDLVELDRAAGRLAMETDQFWQHPMARGVDRRTSVDRRLLRDIADLERDLLDAGMAPIDAQGLIGRTVFAQFLVDRGIIKKEDFLSGYPTLAKALPDKARAEHIFGWLQQTFNGDMFRGDANIAQESHLRRVAAFLTGTNPKTGQDDLFPYQFDIIPVELISSIYEHFVRSEQGMGPITAKKDVHYTRLSLVSLVLDEVMDECDGDETVLDLTCGSGVFLVEALRRLVRKRANGTPASRELIRETLYERVFGSDISGAAIQVAAFSLYLTALELDPQPESASDVAFKPLIKRTLFVSDIWQSQTPLEARMGGRKFDVIVGNPPWSHSRGRLSQRRKQTAIGGSRGPSLDFIHRAMDFASGRTRFGLVLGAPHLLGRTPRTRGTLEQLMPKLAPVTIVNLSNLSSWLFPNARMPGLVLFARHREADDAGLMVAYQVPWTPAGESSHTFLIRSGDCTTIRMDRWLSSPERLKASLFGGNYDVDLVERLSERYRPLVDILEALGTKLQMGLTTPRERGGTDATFLHNLPFLDAASGFAPYGVPSRLPTFQSPSATRPRTRALYSAPLLIVKESVRAEYRGRIAAAVATTDTVFTKSFYGASFKEAHQEAAYLVAGILGSSLASWFFLMTAADFGLWRCRVRPADVNRLPVPDIDASLASEAGQRVVALVAALARRTSASLITEEQWQELDYAVLDLYQLNAYDRVAVQDGLLRAGWQWKQGMRSSAAPASVRGHVSAYADTFMSVIHAWQRHRAKHGIRAEVYDLPADATVRAVKFVLEVGHRPPEQEIVTSSGGNRGLPRSVAAAVDASPGRSLELHDVQRYDGEEIIIVKPAARRHWLRVRGMTDASRAIGDSLKAQRP